MGIHPFRRSRSTAARLPSSCTAHFAGLACLAAVGACNVSLPGTGSCGGDSQCPSGFACLDPDGAVAGGLGQCTRRQTFPRCELASCGADEACATSRDGQVECRKRCTVDADCAPAGLCVLAAVGDTTMVGTCAPCPACGYGRSCAKHRVRDHDGNDPYCNAGGQDCASRYDTDGDGVPGCLDSDCFGSPHCDRCGDYRLDPGESCDGPAVGVDCSRLDPEYLATSSPSCGARCFHDPATCELTRGVVGSVECVPWVTSADQLAMGPPPPRTWVPRQRTAIAYRSGPVWVAWQSEAGIGSATYWPGGALTSAGTVSPPDVVVGRPAIGFDEAERPVVAYVAKTAGGDRLYAARYEDGRWAGLDGLGTNEGEGMMEIPAGTRWATAVVATGGVWLAAATDGAASPPVVKVWFVTPHGAVDYPTLETSAAYELALAIDEEANEPILGWRTGGEIRIMRLSAGSWTTLASDFQVEGLDLSWEGGVLVAAWGDSIGPTKMSAQGPDGRSVLLPGWNSDLVPVWRGAVASQGGFPVVGWSTYRGLVALAYEGERRGWRALAGPECLAYGPDAGDMLDDPAIAVGSDGNTRMVCLSYTYEPEGAASAELRVSCHPLR